MRLHEAHVEKLSARIRNILGDLGLSLNEPRVMQVVSHRLQEVALLEDDDSPTATRL